MNNIDACGLSCPQPVLMTLEAIKKEIFPITVTVDTNVACENIQRLARNKNCTVTIKKDGEFFHITLTSNLG